MLMELLYKNFKQIFTELFWMANDDLIWLHVFSSHHIRTVKSAAFFRNLILPIMKLAIIKQ